MLNVLDVPVQVEADGASAPSESVEPQVFTLDPKDKYAPLGVRRAATTSAIPRQRHSENQSDDLADQPVPTDFSHDTQASTTELDHYDPDHSPRQGLYSAFQRLRRTKSSGSNSQKKSFRTGSAWSRKLFSRAKSSRTPALSEEVPEVPKITPELLQKMQDLNLAPVGESALQQREEGDLSVAAAEIDSRAAAFDGIVQHECSNSMQSGSELPSPLESGDRDEKLSDTPVSSLMASSESLSPIVSSSSPCLEAIGPPGIGHGKEKSLTTPLVALDTKLPLDHSQGEVETQTLADYEQLDINSSSCSYTSSTYCSPGLASNTASSRRISSIILSQPETPRMAEFDDNALAWQCNSDPCLEVHDESDLDYPPPLESEPQGPEHSYSIGGFQGYSLPKHEQASSVTIKKPPTRDRLPPPPLPRQASAQLVQSWDDGTPQRVGGAIGMLDELGYLGTLIN